MIDRYANQHAAGKAKQIERTLHTLRAASRLIRLLDAFFARHDFSQLRFLILMVIDRDTARDRFTFSEIAAKTDVSKPVLSRTMRSLVESGVLVEEADPDDGRVRHYSISPLGEEKLASLLPDYFSLLTSTAEKEGIA
ncbi:MarR family winged helix-turn-helix transcriptional regulator [Henriciella sp.]|uniref:MarR family winged helix-turn-helix transcriptional regulator n=1 Tax=Henriciella sp. TaxID=1968823 RepID=UPI003C75533B